MTKNAVTTDRIKPKSTEMLETVHESDNEDNATLALPSAPTVEAKDGGEINSLYETRKIPARKPIEVFEIKASISLERRNLSAIAQEEHRHEEGYDSDGDLGPTWDMNDEEGIQIYEET